MKLEARGPLTISTFMRIDLLQLLQCAQHFKTDMHHRPKDTTAGDAEGHRQVPCWWHFLQSLAHAKTEILIDRKINWLRKARQKARRQCASATKPVAL